MLLETCLLCIVDESRLLDEVLLIRQEMADVRVTSAEVSIIKIGIPDSLEPREDRGAHYSRLAGCFRESAKRMSHFFLLGLWSFAFSTRLSVA